ncbi:protein serine threonine kinase [Dermatophagoides farinae]|uniref:Protein serine threonine kinase n=1 Tax=Dermatophagoides farinae TaxID=6954 RepID=A0A922L5B7_DERFA|nr:protein serine threonine kinase [Dermatophagoides farinae]
MSKKTKKEERRAKLMDPTTTAQIDERTMLVFTKKGYRLLTIIGFGSYGEVYKAERSRTNEICAVKIIDLLRCSQKYMQKFLPRELAALMETRHENIIRVYDIIRSNKKIYVFMEFASNGDLAKYLKQHGALIERRARIWFKQASRALNYLHEEMWTAHRDIKIENILLNENWKVKLTDFGFATDVLDMNDENILSETFCGTLPYYCPQIFQRQPYNPFKADTWAMGVLLYAMTHNRFPFHHRDPKRMMIEHMDKSYIISRIRENISEELKDLILKLLEMNEERRLTATQILAHQWLLSEDTMSELDK